MTLPEDEQHFLCLEAAPREMDGYWAHGWRHFGIFFFRYRHASHDGKDFTVMPLRVDLQRTAPTRSQRRVLSVNRDTTTQVRPTRVDASTRDLFHRHRQRFSQNVPSSLDDFLSPLPESVPCRNLAVCIYRGDVLLGVTFLDIGESATSAVYAIFEPAEAKRSLGILMILRSIQFSRERGCRYYYPGYAYREPFVYDYKKRLIGLEYLDWETGWLPYDHGGGRA